MPKLDFNIMMNFRANAEIISLLKEINAANPEGYKNVSHIIRSAIISFHRQKCLTAAVAVKRELKRR